MTTLTVANAEPDATAAPTSAFSPRPSDARFPTQPPLAFGARATRPANTRFHSRPGVAAPQHRVEPSAVFTSQSLRAVIAPGSLLVRDQRLDPVVHQLELRGTLDAATLPKLSAAMDGALAAGARWLIVDLAAVPVTDDAARAALIDAAMALRLRRGELVVAGAPATLAAALAADAAHAPAQAASVDQAVMILKLLRPRTGRPPSRARQRVTSLTLPRIEPA